MKSAFFKICGAFAGLMFAGAASAQVVYSSNVVGFQKVDVGATGLEMSSSPFVGPGGTVSNVFSGQLTPGFVPNLADNVIKFDVASQSYRTFFQDLAGNWKDEDFALVNDEPVTPGEGFWIQNRGGELKTVVLVGEVPTAATIDVPVATGLQIVHNPYPADIAITNSGLTAVAKPGLVPSIADNIFVWNAAMGYYDMHYLKTDFVNGNVWRMVPGDPGLPEMDSDLVLEPGKAIWYSRKDAAFDWTVTKPYAYP